MEHCISSAPFILQFVKKVIAKQHKLCYNVLRVRCWAPSIMGCRQAVRHQTLTLAFVGSNPAIPANDPLAQLAEQLPFKQWVRSSNLRRITKKADALSGICFFALEIRTISCNSPVDCCLRPAGRTQHHNVCHRQTCKRIDGRITFFSALSGICFFAPEIRTGFLLTQISKNRIFLS